MKKSIFLAVLAISVTTVVTLSSFTANSSASINGVPTEVQTHADCQGKHCNGTVGCDCSGFAPITNGEVWQQAYCRRCGHKKNYHK